MQKIINPADVYSGCYGNVNVTFFAYNSAGKKGIGCGLNGIQKTRDGDPLGSRVTAEEAFSAVAPTAGPAAWPSAPAPAGPAGWGAPAQQPAPGAWPSAPAPTGWPNV